MNKYLRTTQNYFVVSLTLSDMLVGIAVPPCEYGIHIKGKYCSVICGSFISFSYVMLTSVMNLDMLTSVMNLVLSACDRYFSVTLLFKYHVFFFPNEEPELLLPLDEFLQEVSQQLH